jgi:hypothetical protein
MKQNRWQDPGIHSWWIPGYFYKKEQKRRGRRENGKERR